MRDVTDGGDATKAPVTTGKHAAMRWKLEVTAPQQGLNYDALSGVIVRPKGT